MQKPPKDPEDKVFTPRGPWDFPFTLENGQAGRAVVARHPFHISPEDAKECQERTLKLLAELRASNT